MKPQLQSRTRSQSRVKSQSSAQAQSRVKSQSRTQPKSRWQSRLRTLQAAVIILAFWTVMHFSVRSAIIPSPWLTAITLVRILPDLGLHLLASLGRITAAIALSAILGSAIGLWTGISRRADELASPLVYLLYPLPKIAFLPILMLLFGLGNLPKILLIVIIIIFQFILAARDGVREIPRELIYSVRSLGLNRAGLYRHLFLPAVLPRVITSLRISFGVSVSVLFFGESFATTYGIGYFIMNSWLMVDYVAMFAGILALSLTGLVVFMLIDLLEGSLCRWVRIGRAPDTTR